MNRVSIKKLFRYAIAAMIFALLLNQMIGWAIVEKPFLERLWIGIKGSGSGGIIGGIIGVGAGLLILGGNSLGLAVAGAGYKLLGWATFGLIGFGAGSAVGGIVAIVKKPQNYDFNFLKLLILVVFCGAITALTCSVLTRVGRRISRLIATDEAVAILETGDNMTQRTQRDKSRESPRRSIP